VMESSKTAVKAEVGQGDGKGQGVSVRLSNVKRAYGSVLALAGFSLEAEPGEFVVMLGPSGCGKTTALRALAGLEPIDSGSVYVGGKDVTRLPASKRSIGMVFQSYSLFPNMTSLSNVEFGLKVRGISATERRRRAHEMLEMVGLIEQADRYPHQMSGGQQQRVALARALAIKPEVLLLDEPLSALDAKVRANLREQIKQLQREVGITTFFVTHDQEEALSLADRIAVMNNGNLEQFGTPTEVYSAPATDFVASFVGNVNVFEGTLLDKETAVVHGVGNFPYRQSEETPTPGGSAEILVRPEAITIRADSDGEYLVTDVTFLGSNVKIKVERGDTSFIVIQGSSDLDIVSLGSKVSLEAKGSAILVRRKAHL
jgi:putative spermidine/putrescine transport system ATP-binding protein